LSFSEELVRDAEKSKHSKCVITPTYKYVRLEQSTHIGTEYYIYLL